MQFLNLYQYIEPSVRQIFAQNPKTFGK